MDKDNNLTGKQFDAVVSEIKHSKNGEGVDINGFIDKNLTSQQAQALNRALENPEQIKALLNSPQAKALIKKLLSDK